MNTKLYWKNRIPFLLLNFLCMTALSVFLLINQNTPDSVLLILLVWLFLLFTGLCLSCLRKKKRFDSLLKMTEELPERYLIAELMQMPEQAEETVYYQILKLADKSMLEQIGKIRRERLEYKEYIEQWIHEVKTPITAIRLLCENHRSPLTRELLSELEKLSRFTEQALYYARSEHTEKDYSIREIRLFDPVHQAIADNKYLLLQNNISIQIDENDCMVYSDDKWIRFILNQLISNAVKYRTDQPILHFYTKKQDNFIFLCVHDNGIGIPEQDLPEIFEKSFTGRNGRIAQNSTGLGLYLCKRLCDRLDIGIHAVSAADGTTIFLSFHINDFIHQMQG